MLDLDSVFSKLDVKKHSTHYSRARYNFAKGLVKITTAKMISPVLVITSLLALSSAHPLSRALAEKRADTSAVGQLLIIAPTADTCSGAPFPTECDTADTAAPFLIDAMQRYQIYSPPELSALISLIAFETGEFKYNTNHYPAPGRPGQGTRNMQMAQFNLDYALSISELKAQAQALAPTGTTTGLSDDVLNEIRALVLPDEYSWGSAAWFLTTQCASIRPQLQAGGQAGWEAYLGCVGTTATSDRMAYWTRANTAFGIL
jgi:hypothetical protein